MSAFSLRRQQRAGSPTACGPDVQVLLAREGEGVEDPRQLAVAAVVHRAIGADTGERREAGHDDAVVLGDDQPGDVGAVIVRAARGQGAAQPSTKSWEASNGSTRPTSSGSDGLAWNLGCVASMLLIGGADRDVPPSQPVSQAWGPSTSASLSHSSGHAIPGRGVGGGVQGDVRNREAHVRIGVEASDACASWPAGALTTSRPGSSRHPLQAHTRVGAYLGTLGGGSGLSHGGRRCHRRPRLTAADNRGRRRAPPRTRDPFANASPSYHRLFLGGPLSEHQGKTIGRCCPVPLSRTWSGGRFMHFGEPLDDERLLALLRPGEGIRTVLTADAYGAGEADRLLGRALSGSRATTTRSSGPSGTTSTRASARAPRGSRASPIRACAAPEGYAAYLRTRDRGAARALRRRRVRPAAAAQPRPHGLHERGRLGRDGGAARRRPDRPHRRRARPRQRLHARRHRLLRALRRPDRLGDGDPQPAGAVARRAGAPRGPRARRAGCSRASSTTAASSTTTCATGPARSASATTASSAPAGWVEARPRAARADGRAIAAAPWAHAAAARLPVEPRPPAGRGRRADAHAGEPGPTPSRSRPSAPSWPRCPADNRLSAGGGRGDPRDRRQQRARWRSRALRSTTRAGEAPTAGRWTTSSRRSPRAGPSTPPAPAVKDRLKRRRPLRVGRPDKMSPPLTRLALPYVALATLALRHARLAAPVPGGAAHPPSTPAASCRTSASPRSS